VSEDIYFVISAGEGDVRINAMTERELLERLREDFWGAPPMTSVEWAASTRDPMYWKGGPLVIKGRIARVTPPGDWRIE
jgi:hypothetical protein